MVHQITDSVYRITFLNYTKMMIISCSSEKELIDYIIKLEKEKYIIRSVVRVDIYCDAVRSPRISLRNNPYYIEQHKKLFKE